MSDHLQLSPADRFIDRLDALLKRVSQPQAAMSATGAPNPADAQDAAALDEQEQRLVTGLMRINHTGEVCAQALYKGQALTAKSVETRELLLEAAKEELDHLNWCANRLASLDAAPSHFNPIFFALSYSLGVVTGLMGDKVSLGFVAETEKQVEAHLCDHLNRIPYKDKKTRAIVAQIKEDEATHGANAAHAGGEPLPMPVKIAMRGMARMMKLVTYRF